MTECTQTRYGNPNCPCEGCQTVRHSVASNDMVVRPGQQSVTGGQKNKGGRPKGFNGRTSKMPSALAQAFRKAGLDWKEDFALAIKANKRERIKLWLKLLPYMITTASHWKTRKWKGKPSNAARIALEAMEDKARKPLV